MGKEPRSRIDAPPPTNPHIAKSGQVFVNRNLRLSQMRAIGFDLDHTLAHYSALHVERLAADITLEKLVKSRGYPAEIQDIEYEPGRIIRGLVLDLARGNIIKLDYYNYPRRGYHGREPLTQAERHREYRQRHIPLSGPLFASVDTLFHVPEALLYQELVERLSWLSESMTADTVSLYRDVRQTIDEAHADGTLKSIITGKPERYLQRDPRLPIVLEEFRRSGKRLFLLTNSDYDYTGALLGYLLGDNRDRGGWEAFFDVVIVDARKPHFFFGKGRRHELLGAKDASVPVYAGGNAILLEKELGFRNDQILYFGDHTYGDILRSKKTLGWRTAMIVPELEAEIAVTNRLRPKLDTLRELNREREAAELELAATQRELKRLTATLHLAKPNDSRSEALVKQAGKLSEIVHTVEETHTDVVTRYNELQRECEDAYNPYWGRLFREGNEVSRFAHQVRDFACLYTSRVSNFLNYPPDYYFRSQADVMPHEFE